MVKCIEAESGMVLSRGWGGGGMGSCRLMGRVSIWEDKKNSEGWLRNHVNIYNIIEL